MIRASTRWPEDLDPDTVCFSVDVEWAAPAVIDDIRAIFDQHGIVATFFVTHAGVAVPGHERGIHPNFRRTGETYRALPDASARSDDEISEHVIGRTISFAPEAKGIRSHSLHYDSTLLPLCRRVGIQYDCTYQLPLYEGIRPCWKQHDILEIPTYYADHLDIIEQVTNFEISALGLHKRGIKVFDFHPNIVYLNAPSDEFYAETKMFYRDPERLLAARYTGRGIRTFFLELLEHAVARKISLAPLGAVNSLWREAAASGSNNDR